MHLPMRVFEQRRHPRTPHLSEAVVAIQGRTSAYAVADLSAGGALLVGAHHLAVGDHVEIALKMPLYPEIRITAVALRQQQLPDQRWATALAFIHEDDRTEDHIQSALLSELERLRSAQAVEQAA